MRVYSEAELRYKRSPKGVLNTIYRNQITRQERKGIIVNYTHEEFNNRYLNDKTFLSLYNNWVKSGFVSDCKPSFDRIDNTKGYSFDNLQLMTWKQNNDKGRKEHMKKVEMYDLNGNYIKTFNSIIEASKEVNIYKSNISACCKGKSKTTANHKWKYVEES